MILADELPAGVTPLHVTTLVDRSTAAIVEQVATSRPSKVARAAPPRRPMAPLPATLADAGVLAKAGGAAILVRDDPLRGTPSDLPGGRPHTVVSRGPQPRRRGRRSVATLSCAPGAARGVEGFGVTGRRGPS